MDKLKKLKKYIAGFRSGNPSNERKAKTYYILIVALMAIGSSWKINDFALLGMLLIAPSVFYNFKSMRANQKGYGKVFALTLALFIALMRIFDATYTESNNDQIVENISTNKEVENSSQNGNESNVVLVEKEDSKDDKNNIESLAIDSEIKESEIHFINTGNSDAILIKQGDKSALIDGGENGDESAIVSYLKSQGVTELEYVFATHPDADHIGGLDAVINSLSVKNVFVSNGDADTKTYKDFINTMANKGLSPSVPLLDSEFKLGSSIFKVLSVANTNEPNNNSLVLLYTNGNDKILFTGDAGQEIENKLDVGDIDLLKVGHHGSKTSTSSSFIKNIKPEYAVILVGENNRYNHPNSEVMNILKSNNIEVHRTDECGHIVFKSTGNGLSVECKIGSYKAGNSSNTNGSASSSSTTNSNNSSVSSSSNSGSTSSNSSSTSSSSNSGSTSSNSSSTSSSSNSSSTSSNTSSSGTVYWTPNGKSYHTTRGCSTLSRSKTILSGSQSESGKSDPCDRCH